ncbi:ABC transporter permease [Sphingobacterium paludis]|uniref:Putative ABC transport system permease protein n=1 Tax=Sphingobacterium paludis TaxID=1476465 RepID=A0A4R7D4D8_9SPHI|nr:ABC transporter permease [Sphingobacterium paludis]TDS15943.1 putative ABC transport system permease protein [Sphingobacterium paludis]
MANSFFTLFWRNLFKNKVFSFINIAGLALGFAGFIVSYQYINRETSYDRWNKNLEDIYLVGLTQEGNHSDQTPSSLATVLQDNLPEVVRAGRKINYFYGDYPIFGEETIYVKKAIAIDSAAARIFDIEPQYGSLYKSAEQHEATLVTASLAKKLFPKDPDFSEPKKVPVLALPLGMEETIYGVNKHKGLSFLDFDLLFIKEMGGEQDLFTYQTFVQVKTGTDPSLLETKINRLFHDKLAKQANRTASTFSNGSIYLDPLANLHLRPKHGSNSAYVTIWVLGILSMVILTLAAANFTNLMLAQADKRAKEIALKKVFGNNRGRVGAEFLLEACLQCVLAALIALLLLTITSNVLEKWFNDDLGKQLLKSATFLQLLFALLFTSLLSGVYPAFILSAYKPVRLLKGSSISHANRMFLRNSLLVFQFVIALVFIAGVITVKSQIDFMQQTEKGFEPGHVINFKSIGLYYDTKLDGAFQDLKSRLAQKPGIAYVAAASNVPGGAEAPPRKQFTHIDGAAEMDHVGVDIDYFKTLNIETKEGSTTVSLSQLLADSSKNYAVVNETAVQKLGLSQPIGATVSGCATDFTVIAVVPDVKAYGFENKVAPTLYSFKDECGPGHFKITLMVKANAGKNDDAIKAVQEEWNKNPNAESLPLDYTFLDQQYAQQYAKQEQLSNVLYGFTCLSVIIALMGLFSMSAYQISTRQKETSIRRILGASIVAIFIQFNKVFFKIIIIAVVLAIPISYLILYLWLANFAYKTPINNWIFIWISCFFVFMSTLTVAYQSIKAARAKPVDNLRDE